MNITLIGMAGAGKSFLGKELAKRLHYRLIDVDEVIEKRFNLKLQQIIDRFGEERFLKIEEEAILGLGQMDRSIVSPGGSVIYSSRAMRFLKENSTVVFLNAPFESIEKRIPNQATRGIIGIKNKRLKDLFKERLHLYQKFSDITVEVPEGFDHEALLGEIIQKAFNPLPG